MSENFKIIELRKLLISGHSAETLVSKALPNYTDKEETMKSFTSFEEDVLIEANYCNYPVEILCKNIHVKYPDLSCDELYRWISSVIASMMHEGLIELVMTHYCIREGDFSTPMAERYLNHQELELILKHPEKWDENNVFSITDTYQLKITDKGKEAYLNLFNDTIIFS